MSRKRVVPHVKSYEDIVFNIQCKTKMSIIEIAEFLETTVDMLSSHVIEKNSLLRKQLVELYLRCYVLE